MTFESESEQFVKYRFIADAGQQALRIDKFIVNFVENVSRSKVQQAIDAGQVRVNGAAVRSNYKVKPQDVVEVLMEKEPEVLEITPQDIPLDVVFEDDYLMVINKPAGMVVHPGVGNKDTTLLNALAHRFNVRPTFKGKRPWLVHRIDKNTTGLLVIAKTDEAMTKLSALFKKHDINRSYVALVWGVPDPPLGTIDSNLARDKYDRKKFTTVSPESGGKRAITHYKLLEEFQFVSLVECTLETGRTHQIRVHMKSLGHPLFSDERYGGDKILKGVVFSKYKQFIDNCFQILPRQALHAKSLGFVHPFSGKEMYFECELPEDLSRVIQKWKLIKSNQNFS